MFYPRLFKNARVRHFWLLCLLLAAPATVANSFHISPALTAGPYWGSGVSGGSLQLGLADRAGFDALYLSYSQSASEFLFVDEDSLKTYRIGLQHQSSNFPDLILQLEAGLLDYKGSRNYLIGGTQYKEGIGASFAFATVTPLTDSVAFRLGGDINILNRNTTYLSSSVSFMLATGIIFRF